MAKVVNELRSKLNKVNHSLNEMKAIKDEYYVLKLDNAYLQKKVAMLERENEEMAKKIQDLRGQSGDESEIDFPLHYSQDYDMRVENHEVDGQPSDRSKDDSAEKSSRNPIDGQPFEADFQDEDAEYQLMTYGFVRKTYVFDPKAESEEIPFTEKIHNKPAADESKKIDEPAAQGSVSPVELPSSTVVKSTESDVCRLRTDLDKVIGERNEFKTKYEEYKAKYKNCKRKLSKPSKEERAKSKKSGDDRYARELKTDLKKAGQDIKSLEDQVDRLKDKCNHWDRDFERKSGQCKLQQKEIVKLQEECKRLHLECNLHEKSEYVLRKDVKALSEQLNMKMKDVPDCPNCLKLKNKCNELSDMYKRTLELLVFETSKQ